MLKKLFLYTTIFIFIALSYLFYFYFENKNANSYKKEDYVKNGLIITHDYGLPAVKNEMLFILKENKTKNDAKKIAEYYGAAIKESKKKDGVVYTIHFPVDLNKEDFISRFEELNNHPDIKVVSLNVVHDTN